MGPVLFAKDAGGTSAVPCCAVTFRTVPACDCAFERKVWGEYERRGGVSKRDGTRIAEFHVRCFESVS